MAIQNRRGLEADFDASKMLPGEWAVSTDKKYVRMCFAPGICLRMATYEAFEADMEQIKQILTGTQDIHAAVERIQSEVNVTAIEVENNAMLAESYTHGGTGVREGEHTDNAQYYMEEARNYAKQAETFSGIHIASNEIAGVIKPGENTVDEDGTLVMLRKVSGNNLVLNDSYKGALRINKTFGKSTQDGVPTPEAPVPIVNAGQKLVDGVVTDVGIDTEVLGKNLLENTATSRTVQGVTFTVNEDGSVAANGTATDRAQFIVGNVNLHAGTYIVSQGFKSDSVGAISFANYTINGKTTYIDLAGNNQSQFTIDTDVNVRFTAEVRTAGTTVTNVTFKPMIRLAEIEDDTYEPYTKQSLPINTPNGLPGIEVTDASLANYTDENGKMWVCDTREWERGVDVKRVGKKTLTFGTIMNALNNTHELRSRAPGDALKTSDNYLLCDKATRVQDRLGTDYTWGRDVIGIMAYAGDNLIDIAIRTPLDTTSLDAEVQYILATPIETPIPEEEMAAWRTMHSNEPTTTVLSDADVEVEYPTSRVGAVALDADMRSREVEETTFRRYPLTRIMAEQGWTNEDIMGMKITDIAKVMQDNSIVYFTFNSTTYLCTDLPNNGGTNKGVCEITRYQSNRVLVEVDVEADGKYFMFVTNLDNSSNAFRRMAEYIRIYTTNGFSTMAADIGAEWSKILNGTTGTVMVNNGASIFHGTYYKYNATIGTIHMTDCSTGKVYIWDCNNGEPQLWEMANANDFLPLTGDVSLHSAVLGLDNGNSIVSSGDNNISLHTRIPNKAELNRALYLYNSDFASLPYCLSLLTKDNSFLLYGAHNKSCGNYTGNGDATYRSISTGGVGYCCVIWSMYGTVFVTSTGAIFYNGDGVKTYTGGACAFAETFLRLSGSVEEFNAAGVIYNYVIL